MDIIYKGKKKDSFRTIIAGEAFKYEDCFCMRIETVRNDIGIWYNAVNLDSGDLASFDDDDIIELVDAQLTVS